MLHKHSLSGFVSAQSFIDLLSTNRTHPQSFRTFQTAADVRAWYEYHVCCTI